MSLHTTHGFHLGRKTRMRRPPDSSPVLFTKINQMVGAIACTIAFAAVSTPAFPDVVGFPGAEYDGGVITILGYQTQDFKNGPTDGPHQFLTVNAPGGSGSLSGYLVPNPAVTASVTDTTAFQATASLILVFHAEIFGPPGPVNLIVKAPGSSATSTLGSDSSASLTLSGLPNWAMMLLGFAGLGFVGYRASRKATAAT